MTEYTLGQRVHFDHVLVREWDGGRKFWDGLEIPSSEGVVVGKRTLSNGRLEAFTERDDVWGFSVARHTEYRATEHFTAYIVAQELRRKPVLVKPEHMEAIAS